MTLVVLTSPPARGHRVRCAARFWGWQVWRRATGRAVQVVSQHGWRIEFPVWSELAGITVATGLHEPAEELFVFAYLRIGDSVVDVGANLGIYTVACAALGARVAAFEPSSLSRSALTRNIELNALENVVRVFPVALADRVGSVLFTTHFDVGNHVVEEGQASASDEAVALRTLDGVMAENLEWFRPGAIALLKIDAEGHDAAVLRGARRVLIDDRPVVLVESWQGGTEIREALAALGYRVYRYDFVAGALREYPATWSGQANFIAIADEELPAVRQRIEERAGGVPAPPLVRWRVSQD